MEFGKYMLDIQSQVIYTLVFTDFCRNLGSEIMAAASGTANAETEEDDDEEGGVRVDSGEDGSKEEHLLVKVVQSFTDSITGW